MAEVLPVGSPEHVVIVRQAVRQRATDLGFSLVDQTKIITARQRAGAQRAAARRRRAARSSRSSTTARAVACG
jgi:hypothetical protein